MFQHPVAVINRSQMEDADVRLIAQVLDCQVQKDFAPAWGIGATISFVDKEHRPGLGKYWLVFLDDSDRAGAFGYHDLTAEGLPIGKVFTVTDQMFGEKPSTTASHELLEVLADPYINMTVQVGQKFYAFENCDPCQGSQYAYTIPWAGNDVAVSDFVHPRYFDPTAEDVQFDQREFIKEPFQILDGGYLGVWSAADGWQQLHASQTVPGDRPRVGSRRERRRTPREQWLVSDINTGESSTPMGQLPEGEEMITGGNP